MVKSLENQTFLKTSFLYQNKTLKLKVLNPTKISCTRPFKKPSQRQRHPLVKIDAPKEPNILPKKPQKKKPTRGRTIMLKNITSRQQEKKKRVLQNLKLNFNY
jgi:hypothetical protein